MSALDPPPVPPRLVSDFYYVGVGDLQDHNFVRSVGTIGSKLRSYIYQGEQSFTGDSQKVFARAVSSDVTALGLHLLNDVESAEDDQETEQEDGEARAALAALVPPEISGMASILQYKRGDVVGIYEDTRMQRWVRASLVGTSPLRGNHMPDVIVQLQYAGRSLISLVGEDAIVKKTNKHGLDGETLFAPVPTLQLAHTGNALSTIIAPHDQLIASVWAKKMARLHLYLLSSFEAFGCRLGLLRIHSHYSRLYVRDAHTIFIECNAEYLAACPDATAAAQASVSVSAAEFLQDKDNYRHLPHQWTREAASIMPMIDLVRLAHEMLLSTPLVDPLPLIAIPEHLAFDELVPESARLASTAQTGLELYRCLGVERESKYLRRMHVSEHAFHDVFAGTSHVWSRNTETESSTSTSHTSQGSGGPDSDEPGAGEAGSGEPRDGGPPGNGGSRPGEPTGPPPGSGGGGGGLLDATGPGAGQGGSEAAAGGPAANDSKGGEPNDDDVCGPSRLLKRTAAVLVGDAQSMTSTSGSPVVLPLSEVRRIGGLYTYQPTSKLDGSSLADDAHAQRHLFGTRASALQPTSMRWLASETPLRAASDDGDLLVSSVTRLNSSSESPTRRVVSDPLPLPPSAGEARIESDTVSPPPPLSISASPSPAMAVQGLDKARFLDLAAVNGDARIQPPVTLALQRAADDETEYEAADSERSMRDPAMDFAAQVAALKGAHVKVKLVSVSYMDYIVQHLTNAMAHGSPAASTEQDI